MDGVAAGLPGAEQFEVAVIRAGQAGLAMGYGGDLDA